MRTGAGFNMTAVAAAAAPAVAKVSIGSHSAWHSPVPYLFGGLAAMLGLIAFALLILACSYWKLSGYLDSGRNGGEGGDGPDSEGKPATVTAMPFVCYEEKVVVIMAGDEKPTYLATPISSRASSFGNHSSKDGEEEEEKNQKAEALTITINEADSSKDEDQSPSGQNQSQEA